MANFKAILSKDFKTRIFRYPGSHISWQGLEGTDQALAKQDVQWIDWNTRSVEMQNHSLFVQPHLKA